MLRLLSRALAKYRLDWKKRRGAWTCSLVGFEPWKYKVKLSRREETGREGKGREGKKLLLLHLCTLHCNYLQTIHIRLFCPFSLSLLVGLSRLFPSLPAQTAFERRHSNQYNPFSPRTANQLDPQWRLKQASGSQRRRILILMLAERIKEMQGKIWCLFSLFLQSIWVVAAENKPSRWELRSFPKAWESEAEKDW